VEPTTAQIVEIVYLAVIHAHLLIRMRTEKRCAVRHIGFVPSPRSGGKPPV